MNEQRNLILAIVLSVVILLGFQWLFESAAPPPQQPQPTAAVEEPAGADLPVPAPRQAGDGQVPTAGAGVDPMATREAALRQSPRVPIEAGHLRGSVALKGARIDDLVLTRYREEPDPESPNIVLLSPAGAPNAYYAESGWVPADPATPTPDAETVWTAEGDELSPGSPLVLSWDNGQGLRFIRTIRVDDDYLFRVEQRVENYGDAPVTLYPYSLVSRTGTPDIMGFYILHEGPLGVFNDTLEEIDYDDLREEGIIRQDSTGGWLGITDKYWLTSVIPPQDAEVKARFTHSRQGAVDKYQADYLGPAVTVAPGAEGSFSGYVFAGAKEVEVLDAYAEEYGIARFDLAIDFGWFYFLTKPFFYALLFLNQWLGNFGLAILALTVVIKLALFPLANKSYRAMSKMKKLQPEMKRLQEQYGDDKMRMNQELMALYKREKVSPASGCLPILVQIPVFFALYKVLFVSIEMRHAPFFGWIQDLSAPDPTTIFNLFGLIPWDPPSFLMIGIWPLIMGGTMFLQQKLNPQPADPTQAKIFMFLPIIFTFLLAQFPAGLVIYWAWNNLLSIAQQWVIMRRMGAA